jgi:hypothetical protein
MPNHVVAYQHNQISQAWYGSSFKFVIQADGACCCLEPRCVIVLLYPIIQSLNLLRRSLSNLPTHPTVSGYMLTGQQIRS